MKVQSSGTIKASKSIKKSKKKERRKEEETCYNRGNEPEKPTVIEEMKVQILGTIKASKAIKYLSLNCLFCVCL